MNSLKVCHLSSVHRIDDVRIFLKECTSLAEYGFDVTFICFGESSYRDVKNGVERISLFLPVRNRFERFIKRNIALYKEAVLQDAFIYHIHDPELLFLGRKLKRNGKKVIYDAHEDVPQQILYKDYIPVFLRKGLSFFVEKTENYLVRSLDSIVTVTDHIARRFLNLNSEVIVCSNFASLKEFKFQSSCIQNRSNVCYVGGLTRIRGITNIIAAAQSVNVTLEVAGPTESDSFRNEILQNEITYHGYANREDVQLIFSRSFAGIVTFLPAPNHNNSSPNKLYEYMAASLPVIASNFSTWRKIVEDNELGICVDPTDIGAISDAILQLKNNPHEAIRMGVNGRKAFETRYNWQIEEKKLIELYNKLSQYGD